MRDPMVSIGVEVRQCHASYLHFMHIWDDHGKSVWCEGKDK